MRPYIRENIQLNFADKQLSELTREIKHRHVASSCSISCSGPKDHQD